MASPTPGTRMRLSPCVTSTLEGIWKNADSSARPGGIPRDDAFIGPLIDVFLHEASHALFGML